MTRAWQILRDAGLPLAIEGTGQPKPGRAVLAQALREAIAENPTGRDAEALAAFIFAWQHHWPDAFAVDLAADEAPTVAWASAHVPDDGRYIKLRRIAIENLSRVL